MKNIVLYYSHDGHTKQAAELIAAGLDAQLHALETVKPYPRFMLASFAARAMAAIGGKRRAIKNPGIDLADYGRVIIGTPTWMGHPAPAVREFLATQAMTGKQVALFTTCSHVAQDCIAETELLLKGGTVVARRVFTGHDLGGPQAESAARVNEWLARFPN